MSEETENTAGKRLYVKRQGEFNDLEVPQILEIKDMVSDRLKQVGEELVKDPQNAAFLAEQKELTHKKVRVYARLRKLGYSALTVRKQHAVAKKVVPTVAPVAPPEQAAVTTPIDPSNSAI